MDELGSENDCGISEKHNQMEKLHEGGERSIKGKRSGTSVKKQNVVLPQQPPNMNGERS